jgi:ATP-dependent Zn protease
MFQAGVLVLLLIVMGLGLLYAYRSQTPSVPQVSLSQALQDISAGLVRGVTVTGNRATLEFRDNPTHKEQTTLPEPDTILARAVSDYNTAHPSQPIELRYQGDSSQTVGVIGSIVLSLLPVFLIGGFFYYMMRTRRSS